jgi:large subunit ribosomal protein L29
MSFSSYTELNKLTDEMIASELLSSKKQLFELRLKKATRQSFKSHLFKHIKHRVAQLQTLQSKRKYNLK